MSIWGGYFDDSDNERNLAVGGCVASLETWDRLTMAWMEVLREFDVCWFHATDLAGWSGEFETWKGDNNRRKEFYGLLLGLVEKWRILPVAYVIPADFNRPAKPPKAGSQPKGFTKAVTARTRRILDDNYCKCLAWCLNAAAGLLRDEAPNVRLRVVIADQEGKNGYIEVLYRMAKAFASHRTRLGQELTTQADPREIVPLQVADLIAWESTRDRVQRKPRPEFLRLRRLGRFQTGDPPRMFEGWGPPPWRLIEEILREEEVSE